MQHCCYMYCLYPCSLDNKKLSKKKKKRDVTKQVSDPNHMSYLNSKGKRGSQADKGTRRTKNTETDEVEADAVIGFMPSAKRSQTLLTNSYPKMRTQSLAGIAATANQRFAQKYMDIDNCVKKLETHINTKQMLQT